MLPAAAGVVAVGAETVIASVVLGMGTMSNDCCWVRVKCPTDYINKILNRVALLTPSSDRNEAAGNILLIALIPCFPKIRQRATKLWNACRKVLPENFTTDNFDQFVKGLFLESEGVEAAGVVAAFFKELISFSKEVRPVTKKKDRSIWGAFLRNAYQVGRAILFCLLSSPGEAHFRY